MPTQEERFVPYKPPSHEQDDEEQVSPAIAYPASQHRRVVIPKRQEIDYYAEDHPEIPKIRRATRFLDQQQADQLPPPIQETVTRKKRLVEDSSIVEPSTEKSGIAPRRKQPPHLEPAPVRELAPSTSKYARYQRVTSRQFRSQRSYLEQLYVLRHNPAVLIIGILALIVLILTPILINASHSSTSVTQTNTQNGNGQSSTGVQQAQLNAHELVILPQDTDHPAPPVFAQSAYLLDADTGATLYAYNPFTHLPMLSTTKLMTASLAIEHGNLNQKITINAAMERDISQLSADSALFGVKEGQTYTLGDLLYGLLFVSGNDAAIVIADALAGNLQNFVAEMNQKAHQLGMNDTHFMNPHGLLQSGQYSCAHDLAILGRYSMSLPVLHKISGETVHQIPQGGNHPLRLLLNENQFLWWYPGTDGGKTGYDGQSDFIQVMSVTRNHHHLIGVVMHTNDWWTDMRDLLNWGFDSFKWISPHDLDSPGNPIPYDNLWNYFANDKPTNTIPTADHGRYYIYTGYSISGLIMTYFDKHGGLGTFGYPVKLPALSSGPSIGQQFQHAVIQCDLTSNTCQTR